MKKTVLLTIIATVLGLSKLSSQTNNALDFDGSNDYVTTALPPVFNTDLTIEGWVFPKSSVFSRILFAQNTTSNFFAVSYSSDNSLYFYINNQQSAKTEAGSLPLNQWSHFAITLHFSTNNIQIYLNGALKSTINGGSSSVGADNTMTIGSRTDQNQFFAGSLDELRIWNNIRTPSEIISNMNNHLTLPQSNLISYYKFDQGIANQNNSGITTLNDELNAFNGNLFNFSLNGTSSNWVASALTLNTLEYNLNKINLFPNPAKDFIQISGLKNPENCKIINQLGTEMLGLRVSNFQKIDIHRLPVGVYIIKFDSGNSIKFIKN